jgi:hypothetical protein
MFHIFMSRPLCLSIQWFGTFDSRLHVGSRVSISSAAMSTMTCKSLFCRLYNILGRIKEISIITDMVQIYFAMTPISRKHYWLSRIKCVTLTLTISLINQTIVCAVTGCGMAAVRHSPDLRNALPGSLKALAVNTSLPTRGIRVRRY